MLSETISKLKLIKAKILAEPNEFDMVWWTLHGNERRLDSNYENCTCNTTHCIGGWAVVLFAPKDCVCELEDVAPNAQNLLNLTDSQANMLFYVHEWPVRFQIAYSHTGTLREKAEIAGEFIDWFIERYTSEESK